MEDSPIDGNSYFSDPWAPDSLGKSIEPYNYHNMNEPLSPPPSRVGGWDDYETVSSHHDPGMMQDQSSRNSSVHQHSQQTMNGYPSPAQYPFNASHSTHAHYQLTPMGSPSVDSEHLMDRSGNGSSTHDQNNAMARSQSPYTSAPVTLPSNKAGSTGGGHFNNHSGVSSYSSTGGFNGLFWENDPSNFGFESTSPTTTMSMDEASSARSQHQMQQQQAPSHQQQWWPHETMDSNHPSRGQSLHGGRGLGQAHMDGMGISHSPPISHEAAALGGRSEFGGAGGAPPSAAELAGYLEPSAVASSSYLGRSMSYAYRGDTAIGGGASARPGLPQRHNSSPYAGVPNVGGGLRTPSPSSNVPRSLQGATAASSSSSSTSRRSISKGYAPNGSISPAANAVASGGPHRRTKTMSSMSGSSSRPVIGGGPSSSSGSGSAAGGGMANFVNFTPDDSHKILTGVAPSGSSKTKARREKEAAERRKQLSVAAKRAAMMGDVKTLAVLFD